MFVGIGENCWAIRTIDLLGLIARAFCETRHPGIGLRKRTKTRREISRCATQYMEIKRSRTLFSTEGSSAAYVINYPKTSQRHGDNEKEERKSESAGENAANDEVDIRTMEGRGQGSNSRLPTANTGEEVHG